MVDLILDNEYVSQGSQNMNLLAKRQHHCSQAAAPLAWKPLQRWSAAWLTGKRRHAKHNLCHTTHGEKSTGANHFKGYVQLSLYTLFKTPLMEEQSKIRLSTSRCPKCLDEAPAKQTFMRMRRWASGMSCKSRIANVGPGVNGV